MIERVHIEFLRKIKRVRKSTPKYSIFKNNINCERYLHILTGQSAITMFKFRTGNHKFPVEVGRWNGIDLSERKCNICLSNNIGDEFHYPLECTFFTAERRTHIGKYYYQRPNVIKYKQFLETTQEQELIKLSKFMNLIIKYVGNNHQHKYIAPTRSCLVPKLRPGLQLKGVTDLYVCAQKGCPRGTKAHIQTGRLRINPILTRKSALKKKKKKKVCFARYSPISRSFSCIICIV